MLHYTSVTVEVNILVDSEKDLTEKELKNIDLVILETFQNNDPLTTRLNRDLDEIAAGAGVENIEILEVQSW